MTWQAVVAGCGTMTEFTSRWKRATGSPADAAGYQHLWVPGKGAQQSLKREAW